MPEIVMNTLTPEILMDIAKIMKSRTEPKTGLWLDEVVNGTEFNDQIDDFIGQNFGSGTDMFMAVANFLKVNGYLPDPDAVPEEETVDTIDMMADRNW